MFGPLFVNNESRNHHPILPWHSLFRSLRLTAVRSRNHRKNHRRIRRHVIKKFLTVAVDSQIPIGPRINFRHLIKRLRLLLQPQPAVQGKRRANGFHRDFSVIKSAGKKEVAVELEVINIAGVRSVAPDCTPAIVASFRPSARATAVPKAHAVAAQTKDHAPRRACRF